MNVGYNSFDRDEDQVIDGIDNAELKKYLGKNSEYYVKKFAEKKDKKWFIQINFAALFFGTTWFFYRKMDKIALISATVLILLSSLLTLALATVFQSDVEKYYTAKERYASYVNSGGEVLLFKDPPYSSVVIGTHPTYEKLVNELDSAQNGIRWIAFFIAAPVVVPSLLLRLFANSIYRKHIRANIHGNRFGVSQKSAIDGLILVGAGILLCYFLLNLVPAVSRFIQATQMLYPWL